MEVIEKAKDTLREAGYQVENLWCVDDVHAICESVPKEKALEILHKVLTSEAVMDAIFYALDQEVAKTPEWLVENGEFMALKHEQDETGFSVLVWETLSGFKAWMDVYQRDGEWVCDWNKYIFNMPEDAYQKEMQECNELFSEMSSTALNYLEEKNLI